MTHSTLKILALSLITSISFICKSQANPITISIKKHLKFRITTYMNTTNNCDLDIEEGVYNVNITFLLNKDNRIKIFHIGTTDEHLKKYIKTKLEYQYIPALRLKVPTFLQLKIPFVVK